MWFQDIAKTIYLNSKLNEEDDDKTPKKKNVIINVPKKKKKKTVTITNLGRKIPNRCSRDDLLLSLKNSSEEATIIEPIKV